MSTLYPKNRTDALNALVRGDVDGYLEMVAPSTPPAIADAPNCTSAILADLSALNDRINERLRIADRPLGTVGGNLPLETFELELLGNQARAFRMACDETADLLTKCEEAEVSPLQIRAAVVAIAQSVIEQLTDADKLVAILTGRQRGIDVSAAVEQQARTTRCQTRPARRAA